MFKEYFLLLLLAHIIGDFYLQTDFIAEKKRRQFKWTIFHCLYYGLTVLAISLPVISRPVVLFGGLAALVHMFIDMIKYPYVFRKREKGKFTPVLERNIFYLDQLLHLASLILIAYLFAARRHGLSLHDPAAHFLETVDVSAAALLSWAVVLLAAHKPVNIAITRLLTLYKSESEEDDALVEDKRAGRFIGTLERVIILILIALKQYAAIGLVLTAKSIARYDRIAKDPIFSEYYLIGTLLSTLGAIALSFLHY
ncbi:MAG: DUF3307 domain-containing protein [Firmicutes bacterium]|nr:DUF3307 domain-containing protein [Bacillota bacterium]